MKNLLFAFLMTSICLLAINTLQAQDFYFGKQTHNFGQIAITDTLKHKFWFVNNSANDSQIAKVETDCACSIANYPQQILKPGEGGYITVSYFPYHIGNFQKLFFVFDAKGNKITLALKGEFIEKQAIDLQFPHSIGALKLQTKMLNFGFINTQSPVTKKFEVYNPTDNDFVMDGRIDAPAHIKVMYDSSHIISAKQTGSIYITYDAAAKKDYSYLLDTIAIYSKDLVVRPVISASIEAYFPPYTEQELKKQPYCHLLKKDVNLGTISKKDTIYTEFTLQNKGGSTLKIYKLLFSYAAGSADTYSPDDLEIKVGESKTYKVFFARAGRSYKKPQSRSVSLFTNDPRNHIVIFKMKAVFK